MRLTPLEAMVRMPSGGGEDARPFFVCHPIEGVVTELEYFTAMLPFKVYGFQCTASVSDTSIEAMASHYLELMKEVVTSDPILLLGYSFGGSVVMEMAIRLEAEGRKVHLILIDGSPDFTRSRVNLYKSKTADTDESDGFCYFITLFKTVTQQEYQKMQKQFKSLPDSESRKDLCAKILEGEGESPDDIKTAAVTFYNKCMAAEVYHPSAKFTGRVLLLKADEHFVVIEKDYGLSKICKEVPEIYTYKTTHQKIIKAPTAKKIVNRIMNFLNE